MLNTSQTHRNRVANLMEESPNLFLRPQGMQDSLPHLMKSDAKEVSSSKDSQLENNQEVISSRQQQPLLLYFLNLMLTFCISFQNIPLVFTSNEMNKAYMSIGILLVTLIISLFTTYKLCQDSWKIFNLYVLLDNIFLAQVASSFGFVGFLLVIYTQDWYQVLTMAAFPLEIIFFVGNFRILMLHVKWSKWKVILFKLILLADSAVFFEIGAYYMSVDYRYTNGQNTDLDGKVKDFVLLYIFGLFALFVEMYAKMCEIDQTTDLKFEYELKEMEESKKIQKIRKSVIGMNLEMEKAKSRFLQQAKNMQKNLSHIEVEEINKVQIVDT